MNEVIEVCVCKYYMKDRSFTNCHCHYFQKISLFDDRRVYDCGICSYLEGECLCDNSAKEDNPWIKKTQ